MARRMNSTNYWSRLPGFFGLNVEQRREVLTALPLGLDEEAFAKLDQGLMLKDADCISENVIGTFGLPLSLAANFIVDGCPVIVPMVTEEPSIVAACSKMAKLTAINGGFFTEVDSSVIKGQIQIFDLGDIDKALGVFAANKARLLELAREFCPNMSARGGGVIDIGMRVVPSNKIGPMLLVEPLVNVIDAMGANVVNTVVEGLASELSRMFEGTIGISILSNLCDLRLARAHCSLSFADLATDHSRDNGHIIAERMIAAHALAESDIYRACTHNKGILNGVDAVAIATGNDFRAIEAGAHAYASSKASYGPLTSMELDGKIHVLRASLTMPLAVGVVGGLMRRHSGVGFVHKMLGHHASTSQRLAAVMVSVGLSQCLAAVLALCQDGIQKGHMKLHKKKLTDSSKDSFPHQPF